MGKRAQKRQRADSDRRKLGGRPWEVLVVRPGNTFEVVEVKLQVENWHRNGGGGRKGRRMETEVRVCCHCGCHRNGGSKKEKVRVRRRSTMKVLTHPGEAAVCGNQQDLG